MSTTNGTTQKIKITLTGTRPVMIDPTIWPCIAVAEDKEFDNQYEFQANCISKWKLLVRRHAKGCALVYGIYTYTSQWQNRHDYDIRCGLKLAPGADLASAIADVARQMEEAVGDDMPDDATAFRRLGRECVGDLPAEEIECCTEEGDNDDAS